MRQTTVGRRAAGWLSGMVGLAMVAGCANNQANQPQTRVVVPSAATSTPEYEGDGSIPEQRYVIRMSNGQQDWEVQFPEVATGYEMHIPLSERMSRQASDSVNWSSENLTEADKELLRHLRRQNPDVEQEGIFVNGENVNGSKQGEGGQQGSNQQGQTKQAGQQAKQGQQGEQAKQSKQGKKGAEGSGAEAAPYRPSYLLGIQEVRDLFRRGNYELAMVRLRKLEEAYPGDVKLLSMKGTLWVKLGREELARKAWERVLQIDPDNKQVIDALKRLNQSE